MYEPNSDLGTHRDVLSEGVSSLVVFMKVFSRVAKDRQSWYYNKACLSSQTYQRSVEV